MASFPMQRSSVHQLLTLCVLMASTSVYVHAASPQPTGGSSAWFKAALEKSDKFWAVNRKITPGPVAPRRAPASIGCGELRAPANRQPRRPHDAAAVYQLLRETGDESTLRAFSVLPDEFMWWIRTLGHVSLFSLGVAAHETAHAYSEIATRCQGKALHLYFQGQTWPVEKSLARTANYSIVALGIPEQFKNQSPTSRYQHYIVKSRDYPDNDLSILLAELGAYIEGATLELRLADTDLYTAHRSGEPAALNMNIGGSVEFMLFTLGYLHALKTTDPVAFESLKQKPLFRAHLQRLWSSSERMLCGAAAFTERHGGLYRVSFEILDHIYNSGFGKILGDLDIKYAEKDSCLSSYWTTAATSPALLMK